MGRTLNCLSAGLGKGRLIDENYTGQQIFSLSLIIFTFLIINKYTALDGVFVLISNVQLVSLL